MCVYLPKTVTIHTLLLQFFSQVKTQLWMSDRCDVTSGTNTSPRSLKFEDKNVVRLCMRTSQVELLLLPC